MQNTTKDSKFALDLAGSMEFVAACKLARHDMCVVRLAVLTDAKQKTKSMTFHDADYNRRENRYEGFGELYNDGTSVDFQQAIDKLNGMTIDMSWIGITGTLTVLGKAANIDSFKRYAAKHYPEHTYTVYDIKIIANRKQNPDDQPDAVPNAALTGRKE